MMPAQYLRVFKFYQHGMRTLQNMVCGTQVYSALLTEGLRNKQIMTCKTAIPETIVFGTVLLVMVM